MRHLLKNRPRFDQKRERISTALGRPIDEPTQMLLYSGIGHCQVTHHKMRQPQDIGSNTTPEYPIGWPDPRHASLAGRKRWRSGRHRSCFRAGKDRRGAPGTRPHLPLETRRPAIPGHASFVRTSRVVAQFRSGHGPIPVLFECYRIRTDSGMSRLDIRFSTSHLMMASTR